MQWTSNCDVAIREALDQFLESAHHTLGHGLRPYRYHGQRRTTVMVRVVTSYVDATLWPEFLQLQTVLHEHFEAVTKRVIAQAIGTEDADVELRQGPALEA